MHSEFNEEKEDIKLYQVWFLPPKMARKPIYFTAKFTDRDFENTLFAMASGLDENKNQLSSRVSVKR